MSKILLHKDEIIDIVSVGLENGSKSAVIGLISDIMDSAQAKFDEYQEELIKGVELQREAKHPAPCQKFCERTAFNSEIKELKRIAEQQQLEIKALKLELVELKESDPFCLVNLYENDTVSQMINCPVCDAEPEQPCSKPDPANEGFGIEVYDKVHYKRMKAAR